MISMARDLAMVSAAGVTPQLNSPDTQNHIAVVDIGSNSVRLVVYDGLRRTPLPLFNEKVFCGLGRSVSATGKIDEEAADRTVATLRRFAMLLEAMQVDQVQAVATAAVRDAENGTEFVRKLSSESGFDVRLISGLDEARLAALGVLAGNPRASGLVGDLGGGSLELVGIGEARCGDAITLPLGPVRLQAQFEASVRARRKCVAQSFTRQRWLKNFKGQTLYAVGGSWRALAQAHMAAIDHPIRVIHEYNVLAQDAMRLTERVSNMDPGQIGLIKGLPKSRQTTAATGALVLNRLLKVTGVRRIVFSSYGLREGLLFDQLAANVRERDPLLTACEEKGAALGRFPEHADEIISWTDPLFAGESESSQRLRRCACLLSDIGWRVHPDHRADHSMAEVMNSPFVGINHLGRALLGIAIYFRYKTEPAEGPISAYLDFAGEAASGPRILGRALRLAHTLSGGTAGILRDCPLSVGEEELILSIPEKFADLNGEVLQKRLRQLAQAIDLSPRIDIC